MNRKEMGSLLDHQDWKQIVVWKKKSKSPKTTKRKKNPENIKLLKLEKKVENDELKHDKITKEWRTKIQQEMASKG